MSRINIATGMSLLLLWLSLGCRPSHSKVTTGELADPHTQHEVTEINYGQLPTPESLIATYRTWHEADQITDATKREEMMGLIYVSTPDVQAIFGDQATRLQETINLKIELEKLSNADRSRKLVVQSIDAIDVREILEQHPESPDGEWLHSISELFPKTGPIFLLNIQWDNSKGSLQMGPFFFLRNRWVYVPDPGDMFEVAIRKIPQAYIDDYEEKLRRSLERAKTHASDGSESIGSKNKRRVEQDDKMKNSG